MICSNVLISESLFFLYLMGTDGDRQAHVILYSPARVQANTDVNNADFKKEAL